LDNYENNLVRLFKLLDEGVKSFRSAKLRQPVPGSFVLIADPVSPNALMPNALTVSGGSLQNYLRTCDELMQRADDVMAGIRAGWLKLKIGRVLPLAQAAQAHGLRETRKTEAKLLLSGGNTR
jgi:NADPH:quinone reductase-like Zn-dependent oxidoreductase